MTITIGSNFVSSDSGNSNITFNRNGSDLLSYNTQFGKSGVYPSFTAANLDNNWRYGSQLGGVSGWRGASSWGAASRNWAVDQRGAGSYGFNTSQGRYYAPVSGYYMFGMNMYHGSDASNSQGYMHVNFLKNGSTSFNGNGRHGHSIFGHDTQSFYTNGVTMENVIYCNVGDYVEPGPYWGAGGRGRIYLGHFQFYGHLVP